MAAAAALGVLPTPAAAEPLLAPDDAVELAQGLAEAAEEQEICYGWEVDVWDGQTGQRLADVGSGAGPGVRVDRQACSRWMALVAEVSYAAETSESEDSATMWIESNLPDVSTERLRELGISDGDLLGDRDDAALFNAVNALPLLAAQSGLAPYLRAEPNTVPIPDEDQPTGKPGSDLIRTYAPLIVLAALALVIGLVGIVLSLTGVLPPSEGGGHPQDLGRPPPPPEPTPQVPHPPPTPSKGP
ncbi:MAG: hypothetical protein M3252_03065 [Actinomycetota bacterium]|nr:hypothetical protein [Actinomycetota bacterium]